MYKLTETTKNKTSVYSLYKNNVLIKDTFNLNVIKAILKNKFNTIYNNRKIFNV